MRGVTHDAQRGGLPRPAQRRDRRPGHGGAQRLRDLVPARARRGGRRCSCMSDGVGVGYGARPPRRQRRGLSRRAGELPGRVPRRDLPGAACGATRSTPTPADPGAGAAAAASCARSRCWRRGNVSVRIDASRIRRGAWRAGSARGRALRGQPGPAGRARPAAALRRQRREARRRRAHRDRRRRRLGRPVRPRARARAGRRARRLRQPASAEARLRRRAAGDGRTVDRGGNGARRARDRRRKLFHRHGTMRCSIDAMPQSPKRARRSSSASTPAARSPTSPCWTRPSAASGPPRPPRRRTTLRAASAAASPRCCRPRASPAPTSPACCTARRSRPT